LEIDHEGSSFSKENMPELQDHSPQGRGARYLQGSAPQAAAGLIGALIGLWISDILVSSARDTGDAFDGAYSWD
jgi:hypothetical protein